MELCPLAGASLLLFRHLSRREPPQGGLVRDGHFVPPLAGLWGFLVGLVEPAPPQPCPAHLV